MDNNFKIIDNNFNLINITEKNGVFITNSQINCLGKPLFIQNDVNMQSVLNVSELLQNLETILSIRSAFETLIKNLSSKSINNPVIDKIINYLTYAKVPNKKKLNKKINKMFRNFQRKSKSFIKNKEKDINKLDIQLEKIEKIIITKYNMNNNNFKSNIHNELLVNQFNNWSGFLNLSVLATIESSLDHKNKIKYPKNILNYDKNKILYSKELIVHNKIINFYLKERLNHAIVNNKWLDYSSQLTNKRIQEYHIYNLLTFLIIYDFFIIFKGKTIGNIPIPDIENFFNYQTTLTIPAIYIINNIRNFSHIWSSKSVRSVVTPKMEGYNQNGIDIQGGMPRKHKNTVFDLSEAIMSNLLFDKDLIHNAYITSDKDTELFFNLLKINNISNKITFTETNLITSSNKNYHTTLSKINQDILFENKIYNTTKNKVVYTNDPNFNNIINTNNNTIKNLCQYYFSLGHNQNTVNKVWDKIKNSSVLSKKLNPFSKVSLIGYLTSYVHFKKINVNIPKEIEQDICDNLNLINGIIIEFLAEEVLEKRKILNLELIESDAYNKYEKKIKQLN